MDADDFEDDDFELPAKLNRRQFEELQGEYGYLERKAMFGEMSDTDYERYFELEDLLFTEVLR